MPAILSRARNFQQNSDYPQDKIVGFQTGNLFISGGSGFATNTVPISVTGLLSPLHKTQWSLTPDFAISYNTNSNLGGDPNRCDLLVQTNGSNYTTIGNNNFGIDKTLYYRTFYFMRSNDNTDVPATASQADRFQSNSDLSYSKLYKADIQVGSGSYNHGLGYVPKQIDVWTERTDGTISELNFATSDGTTIDDVVRVDTNNVYFTIGSGFKPFPTTKFHFRVYLDD